LPRQTSPVGAFFFARLLWIDPISICRLPAQTLCYPGRTGNRPSLSGRTKVRFAALLHWSVRQPDDAVQENGTGWGRRQSRWLRTADGFAVCAASVNSILKRSATRLAYTNGERVLTKGWLSLAGAALNLHPMAEGICHDALSFRASTIGRGSLLLYVCLGGRADGDYESSLEIHVRQAFAADSCAHVLCIQRGDCCCNGSGAIPERSA
jgi:hypothetical protein